MDMERWVGTLRDSLSCRGEAGPFDACKVGKVLIPTGEIAILKYVEMIVPTCASYNFHQVHAGVEECYRFLCGSIHFKFLAQFGFLCGDSGGTQICITYPRADTADGLHC